MRETMVTSHEPEMTVLFLNCGDKQNLTKVGLLSYTCAHVHVLFKFKMEKVPL